MPDLRKFRTKSPSRTRYPQKAPKKNYFATLMETEEGRALRKAWSTKKRVNPGRPRGVPDGYCKAEIEPIRAREKRKAERLVNIMAEKFNIEDEYSKQALQTAVEVMNMVGETRERLAAARLVLDFTKQKPASKNEVALTKAEDFLASLVADESDGSETKEG